MKKRESTSDDSARGLVPWFFLGAAVQGVAQAGLAMSAGLLAETLVTKDDARSPLFLCSLGFLSALAKAGASSLSMYVQKRAAFHGANRLRVEVADRLLAAGRERGGDVSLHAAVAVRTREIEIGLDEGLFGGARATATLLPMLATLVYLSPTLALAAVVVLLPFAALLSLVRARFRRVHARAADAAEALHHGVDELVTHLDLWRTFGATSRVRDTLVRAGNATARAAARAAATRAGLSGANEALAAASLVLAIAVLSRVHFSLDRGTAVAFATVFFLMYRPLRDLGDAGSAIERGGSALATLDMIAVSQREAQSSLSVTVPRPRASEKRGAWRLDRLDVEAVGVARADWTTKTISMKVDAGSILAVVGATGSGKSTLLRALLGLEEGTVGQVRYGAIDLSNAGVGPGERPFAWVPQEPAIITATLGDNIRLGARDDIDPEAVLATLGATTLLARGIDTLVSAGGAELSGGERQQIAIARALASGLPVLLLDEPTSGLDPASQRVVLDALASLRGQRTVLLVTHRPEPLVIADAILDLEESGTRTGRGSGDRSRRAV